MAVSFLAAICNPQKALVYLLVFSVRAADLLVHLVTSLVSLALQACCTAHFLCIQLSRNMQSHTSVERHPAVMV